MSLYYTLTVTQTAKVRGNLLKMKVSENEQEPDGQSSSPDLWVKMAKWFGHNVASVLENITIPFPEVEEIRLRVGQPLLLNTAEGDYFLNGEGAVCSPDKAYHVEKEDLVSALERMTHSSIYAAEEDLKKGFLTLPGGNRVGVTGEVILNQGQIQIIKHVSSLNLRIAKDVTGKGVKLLPLLLEAQEICHTLIISPPRAGKTTLLRELIRLISNGVPQLALKGRTIGVVDERGELAGMWQGVPTYDLGWRTDVLDGCPKASGMSMILRSMAPQVIAMDELGQTDDVAALLDALPSGVRIISTAHAGSWEEACKRPTLKCLLEQGVFQRLVVLSRKFGPGTIDRVYDLESGRIL